MKIPCPHCGERDVAEFRYGSDATKTRPPHGKGTQKIWHDYVFLFENPKALSSSSTEEITGMYMIDEEGEILTREVKAKFINGQPAGLEALYLMKSPAEWDRFMRFMERYSEANGLGFRKA